MALYLIGDVQGCDSALQRLLDEISFSPSRDTLYLLGDLVNRGPDSAGVLRRLMGYGSAAQCVLGNHDLHLLALIHGIRPPHRKDTLSGVLTAPDRAAMVDWLTHQHMALFQTVQGQGVLMVHAGVLPGWTAPQTLALAAEVEAVLRSPDLKQFLQEMYGDEPAQWHNSLSGTARLRVIVNALTRLRFCDAQGRMEFVTKEGADAKPSGYMPWFEVPGRQSADVIVAFGHWSTLGWLNRSDVWSMDTGCVWGGCLSALRLEDGSAASGLQSSVQGALEGNLPGSVRTELIQVTCEQAQAPG